MKKISYALTTLATISMTFLPATAIEAPLNESVTSSNNPTDATHQINKATKTNYCISIIFGWWC